MKKTFGKIPIYKGDWSSGVTVKEKFRFTYKGSEFQALRDDLITPPLNDENELNEGWIYISNGTDAWLASERIDANKAAIEETKQALVDEVLRAKEAEETLQSNIETAVSEEKAGREATDEVHDSRLLELEKSQWPLVVTLDLSSELLEYTGADQSVNATYRVKHKGVLKKPNTMTLTRDGVDLGVAVVQENVTPVTVNKLGTTEFVLTAKAHSYYGYHSEETADIITGTAKKNVRMELPIYAGFGTSHADMMVDSNKLSVRTSASGTYTKTNTADGKNFIILIPATLTQPTSFTMGGAPFVMEVSKVVAGKFSANYWQYKSGAIYNSGATVNIKVS
ncbi:MAG: hypothetical protein ACI3YT_10375 [Prevotella sp.]